LGIRKSLSHQSPVAPIQRHAAHAEEEQDREPKACVAERLQKHKTQEIERHRQEHHVAHITRPSRANENPIEIETRRTAKGSGGCISNVVRSCFPHGLIRGDESDKSVTAQKLSHGQTRRKSEAPKHREPHGSAKAGAIACAIGLAAELLRSRRKSIEKKGSDQIKVHQDGIGRQHDIAAARALRCEKGIAEQKRRGADHKVAIDRHHLNEARTVLEDFCVDHEPVTINTCQGEQARANAKNFGKQSANGRAANTKRQAIHKHNIENDVGQVDENLQTQRNGGLATPDENTEQHIID